MANPNHLAKLTEGVEAWNTWRRNNSDIRPDLSKAVLSNLVLVGANLEEANLQEADFSGSDLTEADIALADLQGANLLKVSLHSADLTGVDLHEANLAKADIRGADFREAILKDTNFAEASLMKTFFLNVNLSTAKHLETCFHFGPSVLDHGTLAQSGNLPLKFLRGCGFSDKFIEYIPSLFQDEAIQFYSCFISYSSQDQAFVERLYNDLQGAGVRCWFAPEDMKIGDKIRQRIDESIKVFDKLLIILSKHSLQSDWVEDEVESAIEQERKKHSTVLFPIRVDQEIMDTDNAWAAKVRRSRHIGDFSHWKDHDAYKKAFDRLLRDLKESAEEGKPSS